MRKAHSSKLGDRQRLLVESDTQLVDTIPESGDGRLCVRR
jgi:hypothetical protein